MTTPAIQVTNLEQRIDDLWTVLADQNDAGRCTDAQLAWVMRQETEWGDGPDASRFTFAMFLSACAARPEEIGPGATRVETFRCRCGDIGFMYDDNGVDVFPCPECNTKAYDLFMAGCFKPDHHGCTQCAPGKAKRGKGGASDRDEVRQAQADVQARFEKEEIF